MAARAAYPSLLKPVLSHVYRELFGAHRNILVHDPDELRAAAGPALDAGLEWLVTEFVPGPETSLEGAVTVRLADGSLALAYTRCKLRQHPPYFGAGSVLETVPAPEVTAMALTTARHRGLRRHLQPGGQAARGDGRARPDGDQRPHPAEHRPRGGRAASIRPGASTQRSRASRSSRSANSATACAWSSPASRCGPRSHTCGRETCRCASSCSSYRGVRNVSGLSLSDPGPLAAFARDLGSGAVRSIGRRFRRSSQDEAERPIEAPAEQVRLEDDCPRVGCAPPSSAGTTAPWGPRGGGPCWPSGFAAGGVGQPGTGVSPLRHAARACGRRRRGAGSVLATAGRASRRRASASPTRSRCG